MTEAEYKRKQTLEIAANGTTYRCKSILMLWDSNSFICMQPDGEQDAHINLREVESVFTLKNEKPYIQVAL